MQRSADPPRCVHAARRWRPRAERGNCGPGRSRNRRRSTARPAGQVAPASTRRSSVRRAKRSSRGWQEDTSCTPSAGRKDLVSRRAAERARRLANKGLGRSQAATMLSHRHPEGSGGAWPALTWAAWERPRRGRPRTDRAPQASAESSGRSPSHSRPTPARAAGCTRARAYARSGVRECEATSGACSTCRDVRSSPPRCRARLELCGAAPQHPSTRS